jgi:uncharacterized protein
MNNQQKGQQGQDNKNQTGNQGQQNQQGGGQSGQQRGGSGNFANDRERASEAGRKGGEHSHDNDRKS